MGSILSAAAAALFDLYGTDLGFLGCYAIAYQMPRRGLLQMALRALRVGKILHVTPTATKEAAISAVHSIDRRNAWALASLRFAVGCLFLVFGQYKVFGSGFTLHGGFQTWINRFVQDGAYPFMVPVLRGFVLPNATAIAFLVAYGELAIGLALVLGIWVRAASAFGALYMLTLLFSSNYPGAHVALWQYFGASLDHSVLALCFCAFLISHSEGVLSIRRTINLMKRAA